MTAPTSLPWQLFHWGSYSGSPWVGTATTGGNSGSRNLTEATNPPATGTAVNGFTPADFVPTGTPDLLTAPGLLLNVLGNGATSTGWTMVALCKFDTLAADTNYYDEPLIMGSAGGNLSLTVSASGIRCTSQDSAGTTVSTPRIAVTTGVWYRVVAQWSGTQLRLTVNNGTAQTASLTSFWAADFGGNALIVGRNYAGVVSLDGQILALGTIDSVLNSTDLGDLDAALVARYALAGTATGTLNVTMGAVTVAATGGVRIGAAGNITLGGVGLSAAGTVVGGGVIPQVVCRGVVEATALRLGAVQAVAIRGTAEAAALAKGSARYP